MKIRRKPQVSAREQFRALLPELPRLKSERADLLTLDQARIDARLREYTRAKDTPEALRKAVAKLENWEVAEVARPILDDHHRRREELRREIAWLEKRLEILADATFPATGLAPRWFPYDAPVWASSYRSTNSGERYARGSCEVKARLIKAFGIEARTVEVFPEDGKRSPGLERFRTEVLVHEELDVEILKRSLAYSLKDWLRAVLQLGLNPRVFSPFLPWGIEEKLGMDHFGRDLPQKVAQA